MWHGNRELDSAALGKSCKHWASLGLEDNGNPMQFEGVMQFRMALQFYAFRPIEWIRVCVVYSSPPAQTHTDSSA